MRALIWALLLIVLLVVQATIVPLIGIGGIKPDIMLIISVASGLLLGREQGLGVGFFAGLLQDLASGNIFGLNTFAKMVIGYISGNMERKIFKENILLPILAIMVATVAQGIITMLMMWGFGYRLDWPIAVSNIGLTAFYNAVFAVPFHRGVYRLAGLSPADASSRSK